MLCGGPRNEGSGNYIGVNIGMLYFGKLPYRYLAWEYAKKKVWSRLRSVVEEPNLPPSRIRPFILILGFRVLGLKAYSEV